MEIDTSEGSVSDNDKSGEQCMEVHSLWETAVICNKLIQTNIVFITICKSNTKLVQPITSLDGINELIIINR